MHAHPVVVDRVVQATNTSVLINSYSANCGHAVFFLFPGSHLSGFFGFIRLKNKEGPLGPTIGGVLPETLPKEYIYSYSTLFLPALFRCVGKVYFYSIIPMCRENFIFPTW